MARVAHQLKRLSGLGSLNERGLGGHRPQQVKVITLKLIQISVFPQPGHLITVILNSRYEGVIQ